MAIYGFDRNTLIGRYLHARDRAMAINDHGAYREVMSNLRNCGLVVPSNAPRGWRPDAPEQVERAEERAEAEVKPVGRPAARRSGLGPVPRA